MSRLIKKQAYSRASDVLFSVNFDTNDYNLKDWNTLHIGSSFADFGLFIYKNPIIISGDDVFDIKTEKNSNYVAGSSVSANEYAGYIYKLYSYPILDSYYTNLTREQKDEIFGTTNGNYSIAWDVNNYSLPTSFNFPFTATKLNLASDELRYSIDRLPFTGPASDALGKNPTTIDLFGDLPMLGRAELNGLGTTDYWALFGQTLNNGTILARDAYTSKITQRSTSTFDFYAGTPMPMESSASGINVHCCRPWDMIVDKFSFTVIGVEAKAQ